MTAFPKPPARQRDRRYLLEVKGITKRPRCLAPGAPAGCRGVPEAHHAGRRGLGRKCNDDEAVMMCGGHHDDFDAHAGPFRGLDQAVLRVWAAWAIAQTRDFVAAIRLPDWF